MNRVTPAIDTLPAFTAATALARIERAQRLAEAQSDLGLATRRLMWLFRDGQARTLKEVADELDLEQSTVNRQVNAALAAGLLRRYREPGQPAHLLEATESGLDRFEHDVARNLALLDAAITAVPAADRERFLGQLLAFATAFVDAVQP